eukprot:gnl/TRDRNA2_/TRDRNA2_91171_c1_seq2.p1 gnl/TRDRNA2_/TRDRNA2_91171_c1~~gnl/TRDRNA2_/TRDRNA2_91171_c1_seq2.p1  ORF type:complete len:274 (-),score=30.59 gnl/TRDRNA2_/TRDRNA2_91171_c1_seq2:32-853(-)
MQRNGGGLHATVRDIAEGGALDALWKLYRALPPYALLIGTRKGLVFGIGCAMRKKFSKKLPSLLRDGLSMGLSTFMCAAVLFPIDTVKTRMALGGSLPRLGELYRGFTPAVSKSVVYRVVWMVTRNGLSRMTLIPQHPFIRHLLFGGMASTFATCFSYPLGTLKKRLQAPKLKPEPDPEPDPESERDIETGLGALETQGSDSQGSSGGTSPKMLDEMKELFEEGGVFRFYSGMQVKLPTMFFKGATFNAMFVALTNWLERLRRNSDQAQASAG